METDAGEAMDVDETAWDAHITWPEDDEEVLLAIDIDNFISDLIDNI